MLKHLEARSELRKDGFFLSFRRKRLLGADEAVAVREWLDSTGPEGESARRRLRTLLDDEVVILLDDGLLLPHKVAAGFPAQAASSIGLPPIADIVLAIDSAAAVGSPSSTINTKWRERGGRTVAVRRTGAGISVEGDPYRLSPEIYRLCEAIDGYNATSEAAAPERVAAWIPVQVALQAVSGKAIDAPQNLRRLAICQAASFGLDVTETQGGIAFRPILLGRPKALSTDDNAPADDLGGDGYPDKSDALAESLLTSAQDRRFATEFNKEGQARTAYVLGEGAYVVLTPDLKTALDVVARKQRAPAEERRDFVRNPRAALADLFDALSTEAIADLFVETKQYSDRVLELKIWERPKLGWMQKGSESWLPEPAAGFDTTGSVNGQQLADLAEPSTDEALPEKLAFPEGSAAESDETELQSVAAGGESAAISQSSGEPEPQGRIVLGLLDNLEAEAFAADIKPRKASIAVDEPPPSKMGTTRPKMHQTYGFRWLVDSWRDGSPGVLLADDMGLGKTYQCLAFLAWLRTELEARASKAKVDKVRSPILVVAPTALLRNWQNEAKMHLAPDALGDPVSVYGSAVSALKVPPANRPHPNDILEVNWLREVTWILTTYETLSIHQLSFARMAFAAVVFDEAQKIKDPTTINAHAAKSLNADFVIAMTGTPIENRIEDLWSIMDRVHPSRLGPLKQFSKKFGTNDPETLSELNRAITQPSRTAPAIMLRRMKHEVLDGLPERKTVTYPTPMPLRQQTAYDAAVEAARSDATSGRPARGAMLATIQKLRSISLHPEPSLAETEQFIAASARLTKTMALLTQIAARHEKALVFLDSLDIQGRFAEIVAERFKLPRIPAVISGETPGNRRQAIVDAFQHGQDGFGILVLSPRAAGVGLTITAANHVIHLGRWWNPAVEDQCNDRCYRIGQEKPVTVHLPLAVHPSFPGASFDETLDKLLTRKRALSRDMLAPPVADSDIESIYRDTLA
jgi:superfamily II DNA or RNA helicase